MEKICKNCKKVFTDDSKRHSRKYCNSRCGMAFRNKKYYWRDINFIIDFKKDKCCARCGYNEHTSILQFHHKNPEEKSFNIGKLIGRVSKLPNEKFYSEIKKCEILCPNCHLLLHFNEGKIKLI